MSEKTKEYLRLLFDRPREPVFLPKGESKIVFEVPEEYLTKRYRPLQQQLLAEANNRFDGVERVAIKKVDIPDLSFPLSLKRRENFSIFLPYHQEMASALIDALMEPMSLDDFLSLSIYIRERANPFMFVYAFSVALLHKPDTKDISLPSFVEVFPEKYIDPDVFSRAREEAYIISDAGSRIHIDIPRNFTASDLDEEHRVAYFREDLGVNLHHMHWHLVYPYHGKMKVVNKDRRGELFYYMHHQLVARYNFERLGNKLARTKRLMNWRVPISEAYYPKLHSPAASLAWPSRSSNCMLSDVNRHNDGIRFDIEDLERWRDRIFEAIHTRSVIDNNGKTQQLDDVTGIDVLGNMVEASILSVNKSLYGNLHNMGHMAISAIHDPDYRYKEPYGVMGDNATAARDPVFYRWHAFIDDLFQEYKNLLPEYKPNELGFDGVQVKSAEINVEGHPKNHLLTKWQKSEVNLGGGLDFDAKGNIFASFTHLQNLPFSYKIQVTNSGQERKGTCRIFLAPMYDESGNTFSFKEQKNLFIEMDKFVVTLVSGENNFERKSSESSVVIPYEMVFPKSPPDPKSKGYAYCGCGWPEYMLVPKGTASGMMGQLFVMISDYEGDRVDIDTKGEICQKSAPSYCGLMDNKYPDKRPMGYPFDRMPKAVNTLSDFLTPNMIVTDVTIIHDKKEPKNEAPRG